MSQAESSVVRRLYHTRLRDVLRGQLDSRLDWRQSIESSGLSADLAGAIQQVVRGTRLWRGEKVDVATELLAHFQDGLEHGRTPEELLQSFGDRQAAAKLICRAKTRGRPLAWHIWHCGWMSVAALVIVYVMMGLWMSAGRPAVNTDYLAIANQRAVAIPAAERAWPLYRDALLAMGANLPHENTFAANLVFYEAKPGDEHWKEADKFLADHSDSVAKLREAARRPDLGFVTSNTHADYSAKDRELFGVNVTPEQIEAAKHQTLQDRWLISTLIPDLLLLKTAAVFLACDARRAALAADGNTAFEDIVSMLGVSRHCEETPFLVCSLVADEVQQKLGAAIQDILAQHPALWTDAQLRDLAHRIAASRVDWRRGFEGERACFYDSMQRVYTDDGDGDGRLALQVTDDQNLFQLITSIPGGSGNVSMFSHTGVAFFTLPAANMVVASRKQMTDVFDRVTNSALAMIETPLWKQHSEPSLDEEVRDLEAERLGKFKYLFVRLLVPAYDTLRNRIIESDGARDGLFLGLALELYHREHQKWPESLDELSPRWLPELPTDRFTGKPLHYKTVNDRPIVYSVGADGDDDNGRRMSLDAAIRGSSGLTLIPQTSNSSTSPDGDWIVWPSAQSP